MDLDELRVGLAKQERFTPDLDAVRQRVQLATEPSGQRSLRRISLSRGWSIAAAVAGVAILAGTLALLHSQSVPNRPASPPASVVAGTHWELTSAAVVGMPDSVVVPDLIESLYLYPDGTSVTTGLCFTRQGNWRQDGADLVFTDQRTLEHSCPAAEGQDDTTQRALKQLNGPMEFTVVGNVLHLRNTTTIVTLRAAGAAANDAGPPTGTTDKFTTANGAPTAGSAIHAPTQASTR